MEEHSLHQASLNHQVSVALSRRTPVKLRQYYEHVKPVSGLSRVKPSTSRSPALTEADVLFYTTISYILTLKHAAFVNFCYFVPYTNAGRARHHVDDAVNHITGIRVALDLILRCAASLQQQTG